MTDSYDPRSPWFGGAAQDHVATGIDRVVARPRRLEDEGGFLHRPALDVAGRVQAAKQTRPSDVEEPPALLAERRAACQHETHVPRTVPSHEPRPREATDLTAGPVRAEPCIDIDEPGGGVVQRGLGHVPITDVDPDDGAHRCDDPSRPTLAGPGRGRPGPQKANHGPGRTHLGATGGAH